MNNQQENYGERIEKIFHQVTHDPLLKKQFPVIKVMSNVSSQCEVEIERRMLRKLHSAVVKRINETNLNKGTLSARNIKFQSGEFVSVLYIQMPDPLEFENIGKFSYKIVEKDENLQLIFKISIKEEPKRITEINLSSLFPYLAVQKNKTPLKNIYLPDQKMILIDFEWINCFKGNNGSKYAAPEQVSEFALYCEGDVYDSGYLQVSSDYIRHIHRKLLEKQGLTKEILLERHKKGCTMLEEFKTHLAPALKECQKENKVLVFVYFGREDGEILKQLFKKSQWKDIRFIDFTQLYFIAQLGQEAILNGLGVNFTHTFSSAMDVKALHIITEVFSLAKTVEESKNLQNAILVSKMIAGSENPERLRKYQQLFLNNQPTKDLFDEALSIVKKYEESNFFTD